MSAEEEDRAGRLAQDQRAVLRDEVPARRAQRFGEGERVAREGRRVREQRAVGRTAHVRERRRVVGGHVDRHRTGGERQRLAIARALVQKTEIILFDEATSALDNETQSSIKQAIDNMKNKYTILIIAHRLSTVINSDRILLVEDGTIVDEGTHEELLKNSKTYHQLYDAELKNKMIKKSNKIPNFQEKNKFHKIVEKN